MCAPSSCPCSRFRRPFITPSMGSSGAVATPVTPRLARSASLLRVRVDGAAPSRQARPSMHHTRARYFALPLLTAALASLGCGASTDLTVPPRIEQPRAEPKPVVPEPRTDGRLPAGVRPLRYRLELDVDPKAPRFSGVVHIEVELDRPEAAIILHAANLDIRGAELVTAEGRIAVTTSTRHAAGSERAGASADELVITAATPIAAGTAELTLRYDGALEDKLRGLYRVEVGGQTFAFTQLEPSDARRMLPCFDDPMFKTPYDIRVTVPAGARVFGNARLAHEHELAGGRTRFEFAVTRPLPSYLVALAIGPLEQLPGPTLPVPTSVVAREQLSAQGKQALITTESLLAAYDEWLGQPYPYDKLDLVAVPNFGAGAMENAGLITFREELLLLGDKPSALARRSSAQVISHELSHQWFGNLVTMHWWDDLWLNEGMATYFESLILDRIEPAMKCGLEDLASTGRVMNLDAMDAARRVRQPVKTTYEAEEAFDGITYVKGAAVIGMLHSFVGDDAFRRGIASYLKEHAFRNAKSEALFDALGNASKLDVPSIAASFVDQEGVPLVRAVVSCDAASAKVTLTQQRFRAVARAKPERARWKIPVCFRHAPRRAPESAAFQCVLLSEESLTVPLDECPAWLVPNHEYRGYYRSALPTADLFAMWRAKGRLDSRERVGLVYDTWALVQAGELEAAAFLPLFAEWHAEPERQVVEAMLDHLGKVGDALVDADARAGFERWVLKLLSGRKKQLGWDAKKGESDDNKLLRFRVLEALALHTTDRALLAEATTRVARYRKDTGSIDADTAIVALRVAARRGGITKDELVQLLKGAKTAEDRTRAVRALGSLHPSAGLASALSLVLDGTVRSGDFIYMARAAAEYSDSRAVLIAWLVEHLATLAEKTDGLGASNVVSVLARLCDPGDRSRAQAAFAPLIEKIGGSRRRLDEALELADACIDLRARQAKPASAELRKLAP
ncbi:MAG: hypothetical protein EXR75_10120 [Myxococcales bacterium]|nr:hypothetical protein [Myxococcales bacterium]